MFARRVDWELKTNPLMALFESLKKEDVDILDLTESNPTHAHFSYPSQKILNCLADPRHMDYCPSAMGIPAAREAVAKDYSDKGFSIDPKKIFLTASTSESYSQIFRLLVNPGESILVPRPSYPLFSYLAQLNDVEVATYPLVYQNGWSVDLKELPRCVTANTRAIIAVSPNNPTGSYLKKDELSAINRLCREQKFSLICDEVFADYPFSENSTDLLSTVNNDAALTFTMGGVSKTLGLPQMKLGWTVVSGPEHLVEEALQRMDVILDTYLSVNTPVMNSLPEWLSLKADIQQEILLRIRQNRNFIVELLSSSQKVSLLEAQGGWYAVLKLPTILSEEEWALEFLKKDHVFVHPGYFFDFEDEAYMVLSLLPTLETFQEGLRRILDRVSKLVA